ncbi:MAG TPA: hypothetical protein VGS08_03350 [Candidatus Saccharimonadales bacterium]|nr:hypothetical protein [Candidatus Saccharimonadales bacterium]
MNSLRILEEYALPTAAFDEAALSSGIGQRLNNAGMAEVTEELLALGKAREIFLETPLTSDHIHAINSVEAQSVAETAAQFQKRVRQVEVQEDYMPMGDLRGIANSEQLPWTFSNTPYHPACGEWAGKNRLFWARRDLSDALVSTSGHLMRAAFGLHFEDGFRHPAVQEGLFRRRYGMAGTTHPEWSHNQRLLEAKSKAAYTPRFAAHMGGAAADVRVRDLETGELLDIGHNYPDGGAIVALESPFVTQVQWENRMLLACLAIREGMSLYPFEDWHVCLGDTTAAACSQEDVLPVAKHGPIKSFNITTGAIAEVYRADELDVTFAHIAPRHPEPKDHTD